MTNDYQALSAALRATDPKSTSDEVSSVVSYVDLGKTAAFESLLEYMQEAHKNIDFFDEDGSYEHSVFFMTLSLMHLAKENGFDFNAMIEVARYIHGVEEEMLRIESTNGTKEASNFGVNAVDEYDPEDLEDGNASEEAEETGQSVNEDVTQEFYENLDEYIDKVDLWIRNDVEQNDLPPGGYIIKVERIETNAFPGAPDDHPTDTTDDTPRFFHLGKDAD